MAFEIISSHPSVKAIFVNIFGGILKCDKLAGGIIQAIEESSLKLPLVVRMCGTNAEEGRKLLEEYALKNNKEVIAAVGFREAAEKAVAALKN